MKIVCLVSVSRTEGSCIGSGVDDPFRQNSWGLISKGRCTQFKPGENEVFKIVERYYVGTAIVLIWATFFSSLY